MQSLFAVYVPFRVERRDERGRNEEGFILGPALVVVKAGQPISASAFPCAPFMCVAPPPRLLKCRQNLTISGLFRLS